MSDVAVVFHVPMHRFEVCGPERYKELMGSEKWWDGRADIVQSYLAPNLHQQTDSDFAVFLTLRPTERRWADGIIRPLSPFRLAVDNQPSSEHDFPYPFGPEHWGAFCHLFGSFDWVVVLHCAGDDLYSLQTVEKVREQELEPGLILWWPWGYLFDVRSHTLVEIGSEKGPQAFYGEVYTGEALESPQALGAYRRRHKFNRFHHEMSRAPLNKKMPGGHFCQLLHDANVGSGWEDYHTIKKVCGNVEEGDREATLGRFGIDLLLLQRLRALGYA